MADTDQFAPSPDTPDWLKGAISKFAPTAPPLPQQAPKPIAQTSPGMPYQPDKQLSPQSTGMSVPALPPSPRLQNMPAAPNPQFENPLEVFNVFKNPAIVLAAIGSVFSRQPLTTAFKAAQGSVEGFNRGQIQKSQQDFEKWHAATEQALQQNKTELEKYNTAMKIRDIRSRMAALSSIAAASNDPIIQAFMHAGDIDGAEKMFFARQEAQIRGDEAVRVAQARMGMGGMNTAAPSIAQAIIDGKQPPSLTGLYRMGAPVRAALAEAGFDLSKAQVEWDRSKKQVQSLNGPQMTRFFGLAQSVLSTMDEVKSLSREMDLGGMTGLNYVEIQSLVKTQGNTPRGQLATRYLGAVNTLKEEFANLAQGGYAPTEPAWRLAEEQINGNYGVDQLDSSIDELKRLINYRVEALNERAGAASPYAPNRYLNTPGEQGEQPGKGKYVKQGDHIYVLNPETGEYEPYQ